MLTPVLADAAWGPLRTHEAACAEGATALPAAAAEAPAGSDKVFVVLTGSNGRTALPELQLALVSAAEYNAHKLCKQSDATDWVKGVQATWERDISARGSEEPAWQVISPKPVLSARPECDASAPVVTLAPIFAPVQAGLYRLVLEYDGKCSLLCLFVRACKDECLQVCLHAHGFESQFIADSCFYFHTRVLLRSTQGIPHTRHFLCFVTHASAGTETVIGPVHVLQPHCFRALAASEPAGPSRGQAKASTTLQLGDTSVARYFEQINRDTVRLSDMELELLDIYGRPVAISQQLTMKVSRTLHVA